jgi:molybdopterin-guanine dinucleotide biosynthesis protein A
VLAGGSGSRVGGAKATLGLGGRPLIDHPLEAAEAAGLQPIVVAKRDSPLPPLSARIIEEPQRPLHPLCGIVTALRYAAGRPVVALACDMPLAPGALLAWLASTPEPLVVPAPGGELQPLLARYEASLLPTLEAALSAEAPMQETVEALSPRLVLDAELARFGDPERLFFNVNTREDLDEAQCLLEAVDG